MRPFVPVLFALCAACEGDALGGVDLDPNASAAQRFDIASAEFWAAPFPSDHRVREDSRRPDIAGFPNPNGARIVDTLVDLLDDGTQGWSRTGAIYLPFDGPLSPDGLPSRADSVKPDARVFLMDVSEGAAAGTRHPIDVTLRTVDSPYGPTNAIVALPVQGLPLAPRRRYALVAVRPLATATGVQLAAAPAIKALREGTTPESWREDVAEQYRGALLVLNAEDVPLDAIVGLSVFTTNDAGADFLATADEVLARCQRRPDLDACPLRFVGPPVGRPSPVSFVVDELTDDFCVYEGRVEARRYQAGEPPYALGEGGWVFDDDGLLEEQGRETGRLFVTMPRTVSPGDVLPVVVFVRTGGGGDRPLLDRGIRTGAGVDVPLSGFVNEISRAGWAAVMVDGPLGGDRNPDGADEQFAIFDIDNPVALRDNLRQSALELASVPAMLRGVALSPSICPLPGINPDQPGLAPVRLDIERMVLFGHSMGATIGPLAAAVQPAYEAMILSGAGGSWIDNIVYKRLPVETRPLAAGLLSENGPDAVDRFHPALTLLQWAGEGADPVLFTPALGRAALPGAMRHVLMFQGVVDGYILPPMANAMSLSLGVDAVGPLIDAEATPDLPSLASVLPFTGGRVLDAPVAGNVVDGSREVTRVVVQHPEDGVEDGHEAAYQQPEARWQLRCFLQTLREDGVPRIGRGADGTDPCPPPPDPLAP